MGWLSEISGFKCCQEIYYCQWRSLVFVRFIVVRDRIVLEVGLNHFLSHALSLVIGHTVIRRMYMCDVKMKILVVLDARIWDIYVVPKRR